MRSICWFGFAIDWLCGNDLFHFLAGLECYDASRRNGNLIAGARIATDA